MLERFRRIKSFGTFLDTNLIAKLDRAEHDQLTLELQKRRQKFDYVIGQNALFDTYFYNTENAMCIFEEQCSPQYYYDVVHFLTHFRPGNIVECGVYHGGMTIFLAQVARHFDMTLDIIDINPDSLKYAYNYIQQVCPECLYAVRFFHGNMASYIAGNNCRTDVKSFFQIDAGHDFISVLEDLVSIWFVRKNTQAIALQDIHLRSDNLYNTHFIEAAIVAVFGLNFKGHYFGDKVGGKDILWGGDYELYFKANTLEGVLLLMSENEFCYPREGYVPVFNRATPLRDS